MTVKTAFIAFISRIPIYKARFSFHLTMEEDQYCFDRLLATCCSFVSYPRVEVTTDHHFTLWPVVQLAKFSLLLASDHLGSEEFIFLTPC